MPFTKESQATRESERVDSNLFTVYFHCNTALFVNTPANAERNHENAFVSFLFLQRLSHVCNRFVDIHPTLVQHTAITLKSGQLRLTKPVNDLYTTNRRVF